MEAELLSFINCLKKYKLSEVSPESLEDAWYCVLHSKPNKRTQKRTFQCSFNIHPIGKAKLWFYHFMERLLLPTLWYIGEFHPSKIIINTFDYMVTDTQFPFDRFWSEVSYLTNVEIFLKKSSWPLDSFVLPRFDPPGIPIQSYYLKQTSIYVRSLFTKSNLNMNNHNARTNTNGIIAQVRNIDSDSSQHNIRVVANLKELAKSNNWDIHIPSGLETLEDQIRHYLDKKILILGHGAGMYHRLWMTPNATVIEIMNELQYNEVKSFGFLDTITKSLGGTLHTIIVPTKSKIFNVSTEVIYNLINQIL